MGFATTQMQQVFNEIKKKFTNMQLVCLVTNDLQLKSLPHMFWVSISFSKIYN